MTFERSPPDTCTTLTESPRPRSCIALIRRIWCASSWTALAPFCGSIPAWAYTDSVLIDGNAGQVLTQLWGSLVCIAWCAIATFILLKVVDALIGLRVTNEEEIEGLDINLHGETVH